MSKEKKNVELVSQLEIHRKQPKPPTRKRPAPVSILDKLLPNSPVINHKMVSDRIVHKPQEYPLLITNPNPEINTKDLSLRPAGVGVPPLPPALTEEELQTLLEEQRILREKQHKEALERQAVWLRHRAFINAKNGVFRHQAEVMEEYELTGRY